MSEKQSKNKKRKNRRRIVIILLIVIIILLLLLKSCSTNNDDNDKPIGDYTVSDEKNDDPDNEDETTNKKQTIPFSGYGKYSVSNKSPNIEFNNPDVNHVDMVFSLKDKRTNDTIAVTEKVAPGKYVYINVKNYYKKKGKYNILVNITTFDTKTGNQANGLNQEVELTVE